MAWYLTYTVCYFAVMFAIGGYYFFKVKTSDEYLIASWNMGFWAITGTIISTCAGAAVFIGWVGMGYSVGISGFMKFALPASVFSILLIYFFSAPLRRQRLYTLADLFSERFGDKVGLIPSIFSAFVYSVPTAALQMVGMATLFVTVFGLDYTWAILLSFALILGFTILGGLVATIVTDALQSVIVIIGIFVLFFAAISYAGGPEAIMANSPPDHLRLFGAEGIGEVLTFALTVGPFYLVWQSTWQRIFASRTERIAVRAGITGFVVFGVIAALPYLIGLSAVQFVPEGMRPDMIFSFLTVELLPPYLGGIVVIGLLSALMTGADSFILQGSSNLSEDFYRRLINPGATEVQKMFVARLSVVIISVLSLLVAFMMTDIISAYQWALRISSTTLVVPFLAVMFWSRATATGCFWSMIGALLVTVVWPSFGTSVDPVFPGMLTSLVLLAGVSLVTKHSAQECPKAVYWDDLPSANLRGVPA
ncbi:sodium:solute symporter family protein [Paracoccus beibuensis]|uniref:sodium:solute symporter family protein n=1 Tax=Paracoccus beibuensis TaxID=547602 RepID=UPI00223F28B8|nr:sodium:solute symporter family protein [Paracoccus beibuensis]